MSVAAVVYPIAEQAFQIVFSSVPTAGQILYCQKAFAAALPSIQAEWIIGDTSLCLYIHSPQTGNFFLMEQMYDILRQVISTLPSVEIIDSPDRRFHEIPVCFQSDFALDSNIIEEYHELSFQDFIEEFCAIQFYVGFIGFAPCFPYLRGLPAKFSTPRLATPRPSVAQGSVAIGGNYAGIYPQMLPGGWNIIGRTPLSLRCSSGENPCLLLPGDALRFYPISSQEYEQAQTR